MALDKSGIAKLLYLTWMLSLTLTSSPALADEAAAKRYKRFHYFVYFPVHTICFLAAGPVIVLTSVVQNHDTKLKKESEKPAASE